jgi:hypothetical protein
MRFNRGSGQRTAPRPCARVVLPSPLVRGPARPPSVAWRERAASLRALGPFLASLAGAVALELGYASLSPRLSASPLLVVALGFGLLVGVVLTTSGLAPRVGRRALPWALLPLALPIAVGVTGCSASDAAGASAVLVGLLASGGLLGAFLGGEIEHPGHLLPVAYVASLADLYSVLSPAGPTARIVEDHPDLLAVLALPFSFGDGRFVPVLGLGDVLMTALYLAAARRHRLARPRLVAALALAYAAVLAALLVVERPLPALPALGLFTVAALPEARRVPAADRSKALASALGLTALVALGLSAR